MKRMQRVFGDLDSLRFVDGRLDEERRAAFIRHLADDAAESERVATWGRQNEVLRAAFAGVALEPIPVALRLATVAAPRPAAVSSPLRPALRMLPAPRPDGPEGPAMPGRRAPVTPPQRSGLAASRARWATGLLLVLAVLALAGARGNWPWTSVSEDVPRAETPLATLMARASDAHATYALDPVRPVELNTTQLPQLATWIRHRLGVAVAAPDLGTAGWTLLGGRLVPGPDSPAALFVYDNGGERLSIFATLSPRDAPRTLTLAPAGRDGAVMTWATGPLSYALTAPRSRDWLSRNGEALRDAVERSRH